MGAKTKIEWTDATWNPITGCSPVSEGCKNCYAKRIHERFNEVPFSTIQFHVDRLAIPTHWKKPRKIFVCSMGDLFHEYTGVIGVSAVLQTIAKCPQHIFQALTKRPKFARICSDEISQLPNLWLGVTVENNQHYDRIDALRGIPAAVKFISFEPLLSSVADVNLDGIDWVIIGGETGAGAREMKPEWAYELIKKCAHLKIPCFFKQWGSVTGKSIKDMNMPKQFPKEANDE